MLAHIKTLLDSFSLIQTDTLITNQIPLTLITNLKNLHQELVTRQQIGNNSQLSVAALELLLKLTLLTDNVLNLSNASLKKEEIKHVVYLNRCVVTISELIKNHGSSLALDELTFIIRNGHCDKPISPRALYNTAVAFDSIVNGFNDIRHSLFRMSYSRSRLAVKSFINEDLEHFLLLTKQPSAGKPLSTLRPLTSPVANDAYLSALGPEITNLVKVKRKYDRLTPIETDLINALNILAHQSIAVGNNQMMGAAVEQAFLASQDLVMGLLTLPQPSTKKITRLTLCLRQTSQVINHPGQPHEVAKLIHLMVQGDYNYRHCDKEKTCYAALHVLVSAVLLGLAIAEAVVSHGASLMIACWTIGAEVASLGVGGGQFYIFADSHTEKTQFSQTITAVAKVATLVTKNDDWQDWHKTNDDRFDVNERRKNLLLELQEQQLKQNRDSQLNNQVQQQLIELLEAFSNLNKVSKTGIIGYQAFEVLQSGQDLAIDILRSEKPSVKRLHKLKECVDAATAVCKQPGDRAAVKQLVKLTNKAGYERYTIDTVAAFKSTLLALACVAIFVVTIVGTVFSAGMTAGTILSPIMLSVVTAQKFAHSIHREKTCFSEHAAKLGQFAQLKAIPQSINFNLNDEATNSQSMAVCGL